MIVVGAPSESDTRAAGRRLASMLRPGDIVLLSGQLGAGKTCFVGGIAEGLGVGEPVTSPSFVLVKRYEDGFLPLIHVDVYRLSSLGEFDDLDVIEDSSDGVMAVEWGEAVIHGLPEDHLIIEFDVAPDGARALHFIPEGAWNDRPIEELAS